MNLLAALRRSGGLDALARRLDLAPPTIVAGVTALLPALLGAMRVYGDTAGGEEAGFGGLLALLDELGDGELAANVMGPEPLRREAGAALLERLFPGGVDLTIAEAAQAAGVDRIFLDRLAAPLAMLVGGYIAAKALSGDLATPKALLGVSPSHEAADFEMGENGD